jgi:hypothetical protein
MEKNIVLEMQRYGINTLVQTTQAKIDFYLDLLAREDDEKIGGGDGKVKFHHRLLQELRFKDRYLEQDPLFRSFYPDLWGEFIEDCVIYACLDHFLTGQPLPIGTNHELYEMMDEIERVLGAPGVLHTVR